jgi:hypothetical protein
VDCQTAHLLIEAFHDDELGVVEAATLLAHLDACPHCARRHEAARRLKSVFREGRPVVECPEVLKRRLSLRVETARRFPLAVPASVTLFVLATGLGLLVGHAVPLRARAGSPGGAPLEVPGTRWVTGDVFCVRCALEKLFPGSSFSGAPHRPVLHTADGRLFTILPSPAPGLDKAGCAGQHVDVLARLYPESGLARVVSMRAPVAATGPPADGALTLARAR